MKNKVRRFPEELFLAQAHETEEAAVVINFEALCGEGGLC